MDGQRVVTAGRIYQLEIYTPYVYRAVVARAVCQRDVPNIRRGLRSVFRCVYRPHRRRCGCFRVFGRSLRVPLLW